jgi:hypothetical protein
LVEELIKPPPTPKVCADAPMQPIRRIAATRIFFILKNVLVKLYTANIALFL